MIDETPLDTETSINFVVRRADTKDQEVDSFLTDDEDTPVAISKLSTEEQSELVSCEKEISNELEAFCTIAHRLFLIKTKKLYRGTHTTFSAYCKEKFGFSRVHGNRLINASKTQAILKSEPIGTVTIPNSESALRKMNNLTPNEKKEVARQLHKDGIEDPTAKDVGDAVAKAVPEKAPKQKTHIKPTTESLKVVLKDIGDTVAMVEEERPKQEIIALLVKAREQIEKLLKSKGAK